MKSVHAKKVVLNFSTILSQLPFLLLCFALCTLIPFLYVNCEHTIHAWDQTQYHDMTLYKALHLREIQALSLRNIYSELLQLYQSTDKNYSQLHTILPAPMLLFFGPSRLVYILSLSWFYVFPFVLTLGAIATSITTVNKIWAFRIGTLLSIFSPAVWLPTLNGYPDAGAAFLACLSALLFLQNPTLTSWWRMLLIGCCLSMAVLFRRHFGYDVITFFVAISVVQMYLAFASDKPIPLRIKNLFFSGLRVGVLGLLMLGALFLFGWPFIKRLMHNNFTEIYASYERPNMINIYYFLTFYGWINIVIAIIGLLFILISKKDTVIPRAAALFILFSGIYSFIQWIVRVKQLGVHYTLHFTPWIVLGIFISIWYSWHAFQRQRRIVALSAALLTGLIFFATLFPLPEMATTTINQHPDGISFLSKMIPSNYPPPKRKDYDKILELSAYLQSIAHRNAPIYVVASSYILNDDLLWHAHPDFHKVMMGFNEEDFWRGHKINVMHWAPFADSYDNYPLQEMARAEYVVLAKPFQQHLPPGQQKVMHVVYRAFEEGWPYAKDFQLLPKSFLLEDGVTAYIYKRMKTTSLNTLIETYRQIQTYFKKPPGGKTDWIGLNANTYYITTNKGIGMHDIVADRLEELPVSLIYLDTTFKAKTVKGKLWASSPHIKSFIVRMDGINEQGDTMYRVQQSFKTNTPDFQISFSNPAENYFYLLLTVMTEKESHTAKATGYVSVKNLQVSK